MRRFGPSRMPPVAGAAVTTFMLLGIGVADAEESPTGGEVPQQEETTVDSNIVSFCAIGVTPPPGVDEFLDDVPPGEPVDLELSIESVRPVLSYVVVQLDGSGEPAARLNDGTAALVTWTPELEGSYTIWGEFEDADTGEPVGVATPNECMVTIGVVDRQVVEEPDPVAVSPYAPCDDDPAVLSLVPIDEGVFDVYNSSGELCATIAGETVSREVSAPVATDVRELPRTGQPTTRLTVVGLLAISVGAGIEALARRRASRLTARSGAVRAALDPTFPVDATAIAPPLPSERP